MGRKRVKNSAKDHGDVLAAISKNPDHPLGDIFASLDQTYEQVSASFNSPAAKALRTQLARERTISVMRIQHKASVVLEQMLVDPSTPPTVLANLIRFSLTRLFSEEAEVQPTELVFETVIADDGNIAQTETQLFEEAQSESIAVSDMQDASPDN